jgi:signal transduction histidine kinase/ligand-binding sensor domain-containing protein/DNA-binding response OmpR family regulator
MTMKKYVILTFCILIAWLWTPTAAAEGSEHRTPTDRLQFTALTRDDGLPHDFVDDLYKDSRGFLWIATRGEGLARYDGHEFLGLNMTHSRIHLRSNFISTLTEDSFGRLWVGSEAGINVVDLDRILPAEPEGIARLIPLSCQLIRCSKAGNIWMASKGQLFKITLSDKGTVQRTTTICSLPNPEIIRTLTEYNGYMWFNTPDGIARVKEDSQGPQKPETIGLTDDPQQLMVQCIRQIDGELWIGTVQGVIRYDLKTKRIQRIMNNPLDPNSLSQNFVTDITEWNEQYVAIATLHGINLYDRHSGTIQPFIRESDQSTQSLNCDFVNCLLADRDILWIGTELGGLNKLSRKQLDVDNWTHLQITGSSQPSPVNAIYEDEQGTLWVGNVEGGLNRKRAGSDTFDHFSTAAPAHLPHNSVSCFADEPGSVRLWVGTWGDGLGWVEKNATGPITFHPLRIEGQDDLSHGFVGTLCFDPVNRVLWIGTSRGLYTYNPLTQTVQMPLKGQVNGGIEGCTGSFIDRDGALWLGLTEGLCRIQLNTLHSPRVICQLWSTKLDDPASKLRERVTFITQTADGAIWVSSNGYGIYRGTLDREGDYHFQAFTTSDGLACNSVRALAEDSENGLWVTTTKGLSRIDLADSCFVSYSQRDGLLSDRFYWNAIGRSANGDVYLGSIEGLTVVHSAPHLRSDLSVPLLITRLHAADSESYDGYSAFRYHEREKYLTVEFAALDYSGASGAAYFYRLKGFDDRWTKAEPDQREATYTNLNPGRYVFEVRYAPDGKHLQEATARIVIRVEPYFYKTWWFVLIVVALGAYFVDLSLVRRVRRLRRNQQQLRQMVEDRTRELESQKRQLADQADELVKQNALLTQQNEKITRQKGQLVQMAGRVQALSLDKLAFFTNITHEFRTPLTLIAGPIDRALKLCHEPEVEHQLQLVQRNAHYLLSLVNQLMDFRKLEEGKTRIAPTPCHLPRLLREVLAPFEAYAADRNIELRTLTHLSARAIELDMDAIQKVIINLTGNALKFTPAGGTITVYAAVLPGSGQADGQLYICVSDTGSGLKPEDVDRVFNRFYQSQQGERTSLSGQSGTGIGLYLCRRLIRLHGGQITARNNPSAGCAFRILLPLHYSQQEEPQEDTFIPIIKGTREEEKKPGTSGASILVVEDNDDMRAYIRSILGERYHILEATQGEEALKTLRSQGVDMVVSDLMMPVMDGMQLLRHAKEDFSLSHIPFLMLTARTSLADRTDGFRAGADEYLPKPFDEELLVARVDNLLENRQRLRRKFAINMDVEELPVDDNSPDRKFLDKAMHLIEENYQNADYEIADFIEEMGVSKSLLNRKMQALTGQSAGQLLKAFRMNKAHELLVNHRATHALNISEIAYEVGFNDPKYFTRCFTKHFGMPPSALFDGATHEEEGNN